MNEMRKKSGGRKENNRPLVLYNLFARKPLLSRIFVVTVILPAILIFVPYDGLITKIKTKFVLDTLKVEGNYSFVTAEQVRDIVAPYTVKGFFATDVLSLKNAVEELPWVETASVRRIWPNMLTIKLTEHFPVSLWGESEVLSRSGVVFKPHASKLPTELGVIHGPENSGKYILLQLQSLARLLKPLNLSIVALNLDDRRSWKLTLSNGVNLNLGRKDRERKLINFVRYYNAISTREQQRNIASIDFRYSNGFVVKWEEKKDIEEKQKDGRIIRVNV